jgi:hypothetical protein
MVQTWSMDLTDILLDVSGITLGDMALWHFQGDIHGRYKQE